MQPEPVAPAPAAAPLPDVRSAPTVFGRSPVAHEPAPAAEPAMSVEPASPPVALKLEIDFDAREARIALGEGGETVRLIFQDGVWRTGTAGPGSDR